MRIPRLTPIDGHGWPTVYTDDVDEESGLEMDEELCGACVYEHREIHIDRSLPPEERASTWLHEIIHARFPDLPEATVARLEAGLFPILRDTVWRRR